MNATNPTQTPNVPVTIRLLSVVTPDIRREYLSYFADGWDTPIEDIDNPYDLVDKYGDEAWVIIYFRGQPAGLLAVIPAAQEYDAGADFETIIFVHPDFRGKEIQQTINHSVAVAAFRNNASLWAYVRRNNIRSTAAHAKSYPDLTPEEFTAPKSETEFLRWHISSAASDKNKLPYYNRWLSEDLRALFRNAEMLKRKREKVVSV